MATTKPTKPSITLPSAFGTSSSAVKTAYTSQELIDGYSASIQQVLDGGNVNWLNDTFFKYLTYTTSLCDWLNGCGVKQIPFINSSNQLDYMDAPAGNFIGQIVAINCTSSYIPDGCLPCDGEEYTKSQFSDLYTNFLTSSPVKLNTCSYADYATAISTYGQCGKFAVDTTNEKFKVPTIKDGSYLTQAKSDTELGKAYNESLPNITGSKANMAMTNDSTATGALSRTNVVTNSGYLYDGSGAYSERATLSFNASDSSSTYQDNAKVQGDNIRMRFFVVVSNGQINQASMDWSAWATSLAGRMDTNASNATSTGKSTIVGWGMPDYTQPINVLSSISSSFTAPIRGRLTVNQTADNTWFVIWADAAKTIMIDSCRNDCTLGGTDGVHADLEANQTVYFDYNHTPQNAFIFPYKGDEE